MLRLRGVTLLCAGLLFLLGCPKKDDGGGAPAVNRCEADLSALGLQTGDGSGAEALTIDEDRELIGGQWAQAEHGDVLLRNDRIRVVVQRPSRAIGTNPYGGNIIDADLVRADGAPGQDQFGELGLLYALGRTMNARHVEILRDGSEGGSAVVAVTGDDTVNDFLNVQNSINRLLGGNTKFVIDPEAPIPARITTYYVINPGESRVRALTAFCNDTDEKIVAPVGDLADRGGTVEFFNPGSCESTMGTLPSCLVESAPWFGWQGKEAAYAVRYFRTDDLSKPDPSSAVLTVSGISATMVQGEGSSGLLSWLDAQATKRPGTFVIPPKGSKSFLRDFFVTRDLGGAQAEILRTAGVATRDVRVKVTDSSGAAKAGARVAFIGSDRKLITVATTGADGLATTAIDTAVSFTVQAGLDGYGLSEERPLAGDPMVLPLGASQKLTVTAKDPFNAPSPGKVTVLCPGPTGCATTTYMLKRFHDREVLPNNVAAIAFIPPQGAIELELPPAQYEVVVTRGPEYNVWPASWPGAGQPVDLTTGPKSVDAVLGRVIDTSGWMSADLHVHSVNSPDSAVRNELRVINFAAEGVDILCSTDHDFITDFAPFVRATGSEGVLATMIGSEVTPFDWGHYNTFPITTNATINGGAFDWAGGEGATLRQGQMIDGLREVWPGAVVQMNHPRGPIGSLTLMRVDTATLATHSPAESFRQDPAPDATDTNTRLFTDKWDAIEIMNDSRIEEAHGVLNDWFTFLSRGSVRTGTATSDTHYALAFQGGYPRTFVQMPNDSVTQFDPATFAQSLKAHHASGTNGPFLKVSAVKVGGTGSVGAGDTVRINPGEQVELTVDIQAPEWMFIDTVEVFTHAAGREAYDGSVNKSWPPERIHQNRTLPWSTSAMEPVVINGQTFRRHHFSEKFTLAPTTDSWFVVTVRGDTGAQTLFPLHFQGVTCGGGSCTANPAKPFAFSNPIFVDTDGDGYNNFPLKTPPPVPRSYNPPPPPLSGDALLEALRKLARSH